MMILLMGRTEARAPSLEKGFSVSGASSVLTGRACLVGLFPQIEIWGFVLLSLRDCSGFSPYSDEGQMRDFVKNFTKSLRVGLSCGLISLSN